MSLLGHGLETAGLPVYELSGNSRLSAKAASKHTDGLSQALDGQTSDAFE